MGRSLIRPLVAAVFVAAILSSPMQVFGATPAPPDSAQGAVLSLADLNAPDADVSVCSNAEPGQARCHARVRKDRKVVGRIPARLAAASDATLGNGGAYDPAYLQSAYNLATAARTRGAGQTIAIVDAYDHPAAEADLNVYRSHWSLRACTTANGCFRKLNQVGTAGPYPPVDASWAQEISLDLDMASAICPNCNIVLMEANSAGFGDLGVAVNTAAALGPSAISNSYGAGEWSGEVGYWESFYNHPGIAVIASTGDQGYGVQFPAASPYSIAVGGTTLNQTSNSGTRMATESVWSGAGSGCSAYEPKPTWQHDTGCTRRTVADVAAVADPSTGVWVYDSIALDGQSGWMVFGGTSAAAPIVGAIYALAANKSPWYGSGLYTPGASLFDITTGTNGACGGLYICTGGPGYDGPTGNGTPKGITAFAPASVPTLSSTATPIRTATPTAIPTRTSTTTPTATSTSTSRTLGLSRVGSSIDTGDQNAMNGSRVVVGATSMAVTSLSAYVGAVEDAPRNQFALAIYTDIAGAPAALVAQSGSGILQPNHWNTLRLSATLQPNSGYWLMYNTNASSWSLNELYYNTDPNAVGAFTAQVFGAWPGTFGNANLAGSRYSIYATASGSS